MASTTLEAIRVALLKTTEQHATPTEVPQLAQAKYRQKSHRDTWDKLGATGVDRAFEITMQPEESPKSFGVMAEHEAVATLILEIGHLKGADLAQSLSRRFADVRKLINETEDPAHYPTCVYCIKFSGHTTGLENDQFWVTEMRFRVTYLEANV